MQKIIVMLLFVVSVLMSNDDYKALFDITLGDVQRFERVVLGGLVSHKIYYESQLQNLDIAVVIHGDAYKFFLNNIEKSIFNNDKKLLSEYSLIQKKIKSLHEIYDVEFFMCESSLKKYHLKKDNILPFIKFVPNSAIGLINLQHDGYCYVPLKNE